MKDDIVISVKNVSKKFDLAHSIVDENNNATSILWALKDVSFDIKRGETLGIIGPNGSGKSTLLKILSGVTKPTEGTITIKGRVASILDIGAGFHPELTGVENIFLNGQILGFSRKEIKDKFDEIVAFSGIEKFINEPVKNYSNGMYLRLAFSILAHLEFDIYLFDEVMSVGDTAFRQNVTKIFAANKTVVLVSHNQDEIINTTSRVLTLKNGQIITTEDIKYFTESIDYTKNNITFEDGEILINRREDDRRIYFDIETTFTNGHNYKKIWVVHLKDELGNTILSYIGYNEMDGVKFVNNSCSIQTFIFNKKLFRQGGYSLAFYLTENKLHSKIMRIDRYHFLFNEDAKEKHYECKHCGPIFYPNTLNNI